LVAGPEEINAMKRVPPSVRLKEDVEDLLRGSETPSPETPMAGFVRQQAQYILQVSIEAEATAFLGREHYRRGERVRPGSLTMPRSCETRSGKWRRAVRTLAEWTGQA
jgi:hypothetical protein